MSPAGGTIQETASIDQAARRIADQGLHRLIAVDASGRATGVVSALDVVCGLTGRPVRHPAPFPHYDDTLEVFWTDDMLLEAENLAAVPNGPGVLALVSGGQHRSEQVVWAEATSSLPARLAELTSGSPDTPKELQRLLAREPDLRFRVTHLPSARARQSVANSLMSKVRQAWTPRAAGVGD